MCAYFIIETISQNHKMFQTLTIAPGKKQDVLGEILPILNESNLWPLPDIQNFSDFFFIVITQLNTRLVAKILEASLSLEQMLLTSLVSRIRFCIQFLMFSKPE